MINSISSMNSTMSMMRSAAMQRQPPPPDRDVFQVADSDSDGLVSSTELETLVAGIEEITGNSIDLDEALGSFDADQDGSLSGEELQGLMSSNGFPPPGILNNENGESSMMPPPPEQALAAYAQNTEEDTISQLIELLQSQNDSDEEYSSFEITS
ncbi:MAG: hypothetical protein L3J63_13195 [Geopsychrobacter sp.]|nr:hypothetical protein [Geopsychrobacter sp.]